MPVVRIVRQLAIAARVTGGLLAALDLAAASIVIDPAAAGRAIVCVLWCTRYLPWLAAPKLARPQTPRSHRSRKDP